MEPFDLVDESVDAALRHVADLRSSLKAADDTDPAWDACRQQLHQLATDIVSCRNAAKLLRRHLLILFAAGAPGQEPMAASEWITQAEAAKLAGCSRGVIQRYAGTGRIRRRFPRDRRTPTIERASAEEFAAWWHQRQAADEEERYERTTRNRPPDDGDVWLALPTAALVIGVSRERLRSLAVRGGIPATRRGRRWWLRRRDVEQFAAAGTAGEREGPADVSGHQRGRAPR